MSRVVVAGATGLLGSGVVAALRARGDDVVALARSSRPDRGATTTAWDHATPLPVSLLEGSDAIVNLAGAPIGAGRWNAARRRLILESRVQVTRRCVEALGGAGPRTLVNASAVGYYGSTEAPVDEQAPAGGDFLATVCEEWEAVARRGEARGRVVRVRTGLVLARDGGVLPRLLRVARLGAAGKLGSGRQWMSWIHVDDEVAAVLACLDDDGIDGAVNAVAPSSVRQADFARTLAHLVHRPSLLPAPSAALRLVLGEMADLLLVGQLVVPSVLAARGFTWRHGDLVGALEDLLEG